MPKLHCPCGFVHNLSPIPDDGWVTVRDRDYEELIHAEGQPDLSDASFARLTGTIYDCPECGRLLWVKPQEQTFRVYRRDEENM